MIENGVNGFLSLDCSKEEYRKIFLQFLQLNEEERKIMKLECAKSYNDYTIENCYREYNNLFNNQS